MPQGRGQEHGRSEAPEPVRPDQVERVSPEEARREVAAGRALLVCAYDDESKCRQLRLENAISLHDLQRRVDSVPKNQELLFYCA
jgi:hypothetical protein